MRYLYTLVIFIIIFCLSCNNKHNRKVESSPLSANDSILLSTLLDSLSQNDMENNNRLLEMGDSILLNFQAHEAEISIKIAHIHYAKANYFLTEHYFKNAAQLFLNDSLFDKYAEQLSNIGVVKEMTGSYIEATKIYFNALEIFNRFNLELKSSSVYNNLGIVYQQLNNSKEALKYYKKSLKISEKLNRPDISARRYNNIAVIYEEFEHNLDSALYYYEKAHKIWINDSSNRFLPIVENNIGNIYLLKHEFTIADSLFKKVLNFSLRIGQNSLISQILRNQAKLLIAQDNNAKAVLKAEEAIALAEKSLNKEVQLECLKVLTEALENEHEFKKANKILQKYYQFKEELSGAEQKKQINRLSAQYQLKEKEHKILILELGNKIQNKKLLLQGAIILALLILLTGLIMVFRLQKKNNELKMIQMQRAIADYISQIEEIKEQKNQNEALYEENFRNKIKSFDLTEREEEVLIFISKGYKNAEIAEKMFVSVNTIKTHTKNLFIKLDVRNRTEAARKAKLS